MILGSLIDLGVTLSVQDPAQQESKSTSEVLGSLVGRGCAAHLRCRRHVSLSASTAMYVNVWGARPGKYLYLYVIFLASPPVSDHVRLFHTSGTT